MKKTGWLKIGGGAVSSVLGVLGAVLVAACPCKAVALSAIMVGIFGAGAAAFIQKYNWIFILLGVLLAAWGIYSVLASRQKECACCENDGEVSRRDAEGAEKDLV